MRRADRADAGDRHQHDTHIAEHGDLLAEHHEPGQRRGDRGQAGEHGDREPREQRTDGAERGEQADGECGADLLADRGDDDERGGAERDAWEPVLTP